MLLCTINNLKQSRILNRFNTAVQCTFSSGKYLVNFQSIPYLHEKKFRIDRTNTHYTLHHSFAIYVAEVTVKVEFSKTTGTETRTYSIETNGFQRELLAHWLDKEYEAFLSSLCHGSIVLQLGFRNLHGMNKMWMAYKSGELGEKLGKLITLFAILEDGEQIVARISIEPDEYRQVVRRLEEGQHRGLGVWTGTCAFEHFIENRNKLKHVTTRPRKRIPHDSI